MDLHPAWVLKADNQQDVRSLVYLTSPLWLHQGHIRLLKLHPGQAKDPIRCSLFRTSLSTAPEYEALSYTWGSKSDPGLILLNEVPFRVTRKLYEALQNLRQEHQTRVLWIDALCINQDDVVERGEQVQQMTKIYQIASRTLVWLGRLFSDDVKAAVEVLKTGPASRELALGGGTSLIPSSEPEDMQPGYWPYMTHKQLNGLLEILHQPWWRRAWVVQEVTVAKDVIVGCVTSGGAAWFPWNMLRDIQAQVMRAALNNFNGDVLEFAIATMPLGSMLRLREQSEYVGSQCLPLSDLLRIGQDFNTTDPVDKVFALLGLANDCQDVTLKPDYSRTPQAVYMEATRAACLASRKLDFLTMETEVKLHGLPSWVKDFSAPLQKHVLLNGGIATLAALRYQASGDVPPIIRPRTSDSQLRVDGVRIARITQAILINLKVLAYDSSGKVSNESADVTRDSHLSREHPDCLSEPPIHFHIQLDNFDTIHELLKHTEASNGRTSSPRANRNLIKKLWIILSGQRDVFFDDPSEYMYEDSDSEDEDQWAAPDVWKGCAVPEWSTQSMIHPSRFDHAREYFERQASAYLPPLRTSLGRGFFVTDNGYVGLCPKDSTPGDVIAVMCGASIPFVLREGGGDGTFSLVGGCFVDGLMNGEALDIPFATRTFIMQ